MGEKNWYCLYTKPRMERRTTEILTQKGLQVFFPELPRSARDQQRGIRRPFFPRYIFAQFQVPDDLAWVRWTPGMVRVLSFGEKLATIEDTVLETLRQRLEARSEHLQRYGQYQPGERVQVVAGPFKGYEAIFDAKLSGQGRVRVLVDFLRRTTPYVVNADWIDKTSS